MKEKTKNIFKTITLFTAFALIVGLVTTVTVGENEETFICETDRLLDAFTIQNAPNAYPNGTDSDHPAYTTGLEYSVSTENGEGTLLDPYEAAVSRGTSTATTISLPEYYQVGTTYYKVVGINHDGFNAQKPAKNEAGSEIGTYDLTSITSLKDFKYVGSQAFAYTSISLVEFSKNLIEFSPSAFFHCKSLERTDFIQLDGESTSTTGTYAAIKSVGDNCFTDCINYTGMILPRTLTRIGNGAYQNCSSLTSIFLPATDVTGEHLEVGDYAFAGCTKVTIVYISSKVEAIGAHAFEGCVNAKGYSALPLSELLEQIGEDGDGDWNFLFSGSEYDNNGDDDNFLDFTGREDVKDLKYDQPYFYTLNSDGTCTLDMYDGSTSDDPADVYLYGKKRTIPSTRGAGYPVGRIGQELFKDNTEMEELVMPNTVKSIGLAAFAGCTNLEKVGLSSGLNIIEKYAFAPWNGASTDAQANKLTDLEIPANVEEIEEYAFSHMYDMMKIKFLGSDDGTSKLKHIGDYAFYKAGWHYKDTYYQGGSFTEVRNALVLNMKPKLSTGYSGATTSSGGRPRSGRDTYTEIGNFAFYGNQWIGSIRITSDHLVTNGFVFANCYWLIEADLGEGLVILGNGKNAGDGDGSSARDGRGRLFSVSVDENNINIARPAVDNPSAPTDLGNPLTNTTDADKKPLVPMSSLYLPKLESGQSTGQGTLDGRYHTMIYTKCPSNGGTNWLFQWKGGYTGYCDLEPAYLDMGSPGTATSVDVSNGKVSNDINTAGFGDYYGVDTGFGSEYKIGSGGLSYYQLKQGGYFGVTFAHASVNESNGVWSASYKDDTGATISSINSGKRYGFTTYDPDTGRAQFDFIQKANNSYELILSKFHYNPYWEQSKNVVIPSSVTFGGRNFSVTEIGNCAFFRNICPETHAWVGDASSSSNNRVYVSPQSDNRTTNPNQDANGNYYAEDYNDDYYNLESVTLPTTIKRIGGNAFYMCAGLQSVKTAGDNTEGKFPDNLEKIGQYAFSFTGITNVSLGNKVTVLGNAYGLCNPFAGCMALTSISVAAGGTTIYQSSGGYLTDKSTGKNIIMSPLGTTATDVTIPAGTTTLSSLSFRGARTIKNLTIPASLTTIEAGCFDGIYYGETNMDHGNEGRGDGTFKGIYKRRKSALDKITVTGGTSGLTTIGDFAFYYCDKFDGITFPNSLYTIGSYAFYHCSDANNYYFPNSLHDIGAQAFAKNTNFIKIKTEKKPNGEDDRYLNLADTSLEFIGAEAFKPSDSGTTYFDTLSLPATLTTLNEGRIFTDSYKGLTTVYVHTNLVEMNTGAFKGHSNMTVFKTWSGTVDSNGDVQNVSPSNALPPNLTTIGENCFYECTGLTSFGTFPASLTTVGKNSFYKCTNAGFTSADFSDSTENLLIREGAFSGCNKITSITLVDAPGSRDKAGGSLTIEKNAFQNCTSVTTYVIIPRGAEVKSSAFSGAKMTQIFVCDTFADGSVKVPAAIATGTPAASSVYYYARNTGDTTGAPNGTKFWHYEGTTPTIGVGSEP